MDLSGELALVLPEHDLTAADFKDFARALGRQAWVPVFLQTYRRMMSSESTVEENRKFLADIGRVIGVEEEKKIDPNANLATFNFVFGAPGQPMTMTAELVDDAPAPVPILASDDSQLGVMKVDPDADIAFLDALAAEAARRKLTLPTRPKENSDAPSPPPGEREPDAPAPRPERDQPQPAGPAPLAPESGPSPAQGLGSQDAGEKIADYGFDDLDAALGL
jgi:hypothetical protein